MSRQQTLDPIVAAARSVLHAQFHDTSPETVDGLARFVGTVIRTLGRQHAAVRVGVTVIAPLVVLQSLGLDWAETGPEGVVGLDWAAPRPAVAVDAALDEILVANGVVADPEGLDDDEEEGLPG